MSIDFVNRNFKKKTFLQALNSCAAVIIGSNCKKFIDLIKLPPLVMYLITENSFRLFKVYLIIYSRILVFGLYKQLLY